MGELLVGTAYLQEQRYIATTKLIGVGSYISRRRSTTSDAFKRSLGGLIQQHSVILHMESVRPNSWASYGRGGRSPFMTFQVTVLETKLWKGTFPVKAYQGNQYNTGVSSNTIYAPFERVCTSTTTIPKAKISACLLVMHCPNKISGADHLAV